MKLAVRIAISLVAAVAIVSPIAAAAQPEAASPQAAVESLIAADRAFSAAAANVDTLTAISAFLHDDVVMPLPNGSFARGRAAVTEALRGNPFNASSRAQWTPIRGGISADGRHGFTLGFMTISGQDGSIRLAKYMTYWVRTPEGWRAAAYKRAPRPEGEVSMALLSPIVPARLVATSSDPETLRALREGLRQAEQAFSDEAQRIGIGAAFRRNGSADATNMGNGAGYTIGAEAIGNAIGGDAPPSPVSWGADDAIVADSGDLGVTFGLIRPNGPVPEGRPAASAFFTIWRRATPQERWLYVAE
jgi:ketosteroid isomerase-like protein